MPDLHAMIRVDAEALATLARPAADPDLLKRIEVLLRDVRDRLAADARIAVLLCGP